MLNFIKLTLDDIEKIKPYFLYSANRACDNTVGGTFIWRDYFTAEYAIWNDTLVFKMKINYHNGITAFTYPLGDDVAGCIERLEDYCDCEGLAVTYCKITQEELSTLKTIYCNTRIYHESNWGDYLYNAEDLVNLSGRKYHGQKNHLNNFKKAHPDYSFEVMTSDNVIDVLDFYRTLKAPPPDSSEIFIEDYQKTFEVLENFDVYGLPGGFIRVDGKVTAFAIGEVIGDVLHIHIEKADTSYKGMYQVINNEFARNFSGAGVKFINREDDAGDAGLRIAKQSYHPVELIDKYIVEVL